MCAKICAERELWGRGKGIKITLYIERKSFITFEKARDWESFDILIFYLFYLPCLTTLKSAISL